MVQSGVAAVKYTVNHYNRANTTDPPKPQLEKVKDTHREKIPHEKRYFLQTHHQSKSKLLHNCNSVLPILIAYHIILVMV